MRMPVRTPGPTMRGGWPKRWRESSSMLRERSGTTLLTTTADITSGSSPAERSRETTTRPSSAPVARGSVCNRKSVTSRLPSKAPTTVSVLSTSMASSIEADCDAVRRARATTASRTGRIGAAVKRVHLMCDSTADLGPAYYPAHDVEVVPLSIIFGEEQFRDQEEMSTGEFYRRMRAGGPHPRTSQPSPGGFAEGFERLGSDGGAVVCTTISSDLSGTAGSAMQARQALPNLDIRVVETKSCGPAHGAALAMAVAIRDRGGSADAIVAAIDRLKAAQRLVFTVENLESLRRGGRIGAARALLGPVLSIKPILAF